MKLELSKPKEELFLKTALWNSIVEVFKHEKNIDLTSYLVSISIKWKKIIVKTWNPMVNSELLSFDEKIKEVFKEKVKGIWKEFEEVEVRYR